VIKGKVLEAWRQSGAITGPFGYPSADTSVAGDMQTGKFVGPEGTEIQWSKAAGLLTIPAALAAKIPGFGANAPTAEGTSSVSAAPGKTITTEKVEKKGFNWLWLLLAVPLIAGVGWLLRKRPQEVAPVRVAERAPVVKPTPPPARPAPVVKAPAPTPPAPRPPAPAPAKVAPVTKVTPPPAPKPVTPPLSEPPKATIRTETSEDVTTVVRYEDSAAGTETTARVTYENNALGDDQESVADKSDTIPD
jgi:outer membrane biosynthesis protein TonB